MQRRWIALAITALLLSAATSTWGQTQPPSEKMIIHAGSAMTWSDRRSNIIQLTGPVEIRLDTATLKGDSAVIWLTEQPNATVPNNKAEIALIGNAVLTQPALGVTRSGDHLFVTAAVRGDIILTAGERDSLDQSGTPLYKQALILREGGGLVETTTGPSSRPVLEPAEEAPEVGGAGGEGGEEVPGPVRHGRQIAPDRTVETRLHFDHVETTPALDDTLSLELMGNVTILQHRASGDFLELRAERAVVFTSLPSNALTNPGDLGSIGNKITGVYLEGDVRINYTPASPETTGTAAKPEQRLEAERVFYDLKKNQAILTDAVLYSSEPTTNTPIVIRARRLRQVAAGEYEGSQVQMSTSSFEDPSYSVNTDQVYITQSQIPSPPGSDEPMQTNTDFVATNDTLHMGGVPVFFWPSVSGSINNDPDPLRSIDIGSDNRRGFTVATTLGLFELTGRPHPQDLDISLTPTFFAERGPGIGFDGKYQGTNINEDTKGVTDFSGDFNAFLMTDHGTDRFSDSRSNVNPPDQIRGKVGIEHNEFFGDHWQAQFRLGYVSDPTFLEEYYPQRFFEDQPYDAEFYFKRQENTEAITLEGNVDTTRFVTNAEQQQDQFDVEHLPELGYRRMGDAPAGDSLTFFSENTADRLRFARSHATLADQGFVFVGPGLPSEGYTGTSVSPTYRGDSRQELDYPVQVGQIKVVPYVIGRATAWSNSPNNDSQNRLYAGGGVRMTTAFWHVYDDVDNELLDIHRLRHVIEPEINLYTSAETTDRSKLFIYDQSVDAVNDITAADFNLHQIWQTYRGGPGKEQSVDFLTWNIDATAYENPPKDAGIFPTKFRGLFFPFEPETSIPRDSVNSDLTWLISDTTAFLADAEYNSDHGELATASAGFAVRRDPRLSYYLGISYIEQLNSDVATFAAQYQIDAKYSILFSQSYDFGQNKDVGTNFTVERNFDKLIADVTIYHDSVTGENGFRFNLFPEGFARSNAGNALGNIFEGNR